MGRTSISWTDFTFNPWWGCTEVSPGCDRCYARELDKHWFPLIKLIGNDEEKVAQHWGKGMPRREFPDKHWNEPLKWNRDALQTFGRPARVFCASMADIMDDEAPAGARERLWRLIDETPNLIWQLLTKRPHRYAQYLPDHFKHDNVWPGTTAENQHFYDIRWPILSTLKYRFDNLWISYEPALGPLSMRRWSTVPNWIIFGGESGNGRRECKREWADSLLAECRGINANVAFFMKQMGGRTPEQGKAAIPPELLIQEFPA